MPLCQELKFGGVTIHVKTMEGLVGASANANLLDTPFQVFKEARRRGDTGTMERAMGYVGEFSGKAGEYMEKAKKGIEEDGKEAREKVELEQENAIQKRKVEHKELEKKEKESKGGLTDTVEISEGSME